MTSNQQAILKTIIYADQFDYSLTLSEIFLRLISHRPVSKTIIHQCLNQLVGDKLIATSGSNYFLPGRNQLPLIKRNRLKSSTKKYLIAQKIAEKLSRISTIEAIFLTGTVATNNADTDDDIDVMIIAKAGKLWTTRMLTTLYLSILGVRRKPGQTDVSNLICANLYLDSRHLGVPKHQQNLYTAHEVILAQPIFDRHHLSTDFLISNIWVNKFLGNTKITKSSKNNYSKNQNPHWLESISYNLQKAYMSSKITREIITQNSAYFHPEDTASVILKRYHQSLKHYEITQS